MLEHITPQQDFARLLTDNYDKDRTTCVKAVLAVRQRGCKGNTYRQDNKKDIYSSAEDMSGVLINHDERLCKDTGSHVMGMN